MKRILTIGLLVILSSVLLISTQAFAQEPVPSPTPANYFLGWNHNGINVDGFKLFIDGGNVFDLGLPTPEPDGKYLSPFPALTPGPHTLEVLAFNVAGESGKAVLVVNVVVVPADPSNLIIFVQ